MNSLISQINNSIAAKKSLLSIEDKIDKSIKLIASSLKGVRLCFVAMVDRLQMHSI